MYRGLMDSFSRPIPRESETPAMWQCRCHPKGIIYCLSNIKSKVDPGPYEPVAVTHATVNLVISFCLLPAAIVVAFPMGTDRAELR